MNYKPLIELANDEQALLSIADYLKIFKPTIRKSESHVSISGRDTERAFSNETSIAIEFNGRIEVIRLMHRVNVFELVDFIRSLGYSA